VVDIPAGWLAIITLALTAVTGSVAYIWRQRDAQFQRMIEQLQRQVEKLEAEVAAGRLKIEKLQNDAMESYRAQLAEALSRAIIDRQVAASLETLLARIPPNDA
jgi:cell division protein FtsB